MSGLHYEFAIFRAISVVVTVLNVGFVLSLRQIRGTPGHAAAMSIYAHHMAFPPPYITLQDQIVNKIDDLSHCSLLSAFCSRRVRKLDALSIAQ